MMNWIMRAVKDITVFGIGLCIFLIIMHVVAIRNMLLLALIAIVFGLTALYLYITFKEAEQKKRRRRRESL